jgi:hypothetical protein
MISDDEINYYANLYLSIKGSNSTTTFEEFLMKAIARKLRRKP